jgi:rod shape-determining protein MreC
MKPNRAFLGVVVFVLFVTALPLPASVAVRSSVTSYLETPISMFRGAAQFTLDLLRFRENAAENRRLKRKLGTLRLKQFYDEELHLENRRLLKLLELREALPTAVRSSVACRVIGRSPVGTQGTLFLDKGAREGLTADRLVLADNCLIGRVAEVGPTTSKVVLITDPNFRAGGLIQRTRQEGMIYGTAAGECRIKYVTLETPLKPGDVVQTAGFGGYFPKGLLVGSVERVWKEPGQIYQVAAIRPAVDLSRAEEVLVVE